MTHWWLPGITGCGAGLHENFTGEPCEVTCSQCRAYVETRWASGSRLEGQLAAMGVY